ncbi:MAG TPA: hypothetical protein VFG83_03875, partial [Kofleriaceae bacterium]|nr:hypothetical protein [Kofleriaceae bacterium]
MYRWLFIIACTLALPATARAQPAPAPAPDEPAEATPATTPPAAAPPAAAPAPAPATATATPAPATAAPVTDEPPREGTSGRSGFMDVRLNLTLVNENVFVEPGETIPSVPGWRFGTPSSLGTLFFDNYDTRFSGYETLSHAVLYRRHDHANWEVEGALVLRINDLSQQNIDLSDAGSYVRVAYWTDPSRKDLERISLTAFPTSSDRFRLGYSYRLSWGGSPEYQRSRSAVPGVKLQYDNGRAYGFVGAKSAIVLDRETAEEEAVVAFLGGGGIDITPMFRIEANGGYFNRGGNELPDVISEDVHLYGGSVQVAVHDGMPVLSSVDYKLYRNEPFRVPRLFEQPTYAGGIAWLVAAEATLLGQTLKDPEVTGGTTVQYGAAGDINARVMIGHTRLRLDLQYRDLAFILHSTPSLPTYSDFPAIYDQTADFFAAAGVDHNIAGTGLTVGVVAGVDKPATLTTPTGVIPGDTVEGGGTTTAVIRNEGDITILPEGEDALPQFAVKFRGRLNFSEYFASIVEAYYSYDPNESRLRRE